MWRRLINCGTLGVKSHLNHELCEAQDFITILFSEMHNVITQQLNKVLNLDNVIYLCLSQPLCEPQGFYNFSRSTIESTEAKLPERLFNIKKRVIRIWFEICVFIFVPQFCILISYLVEVGLCWDLVFEQYSFYPNCTFAYTREKKN